MRIGVHYHKARQTILDNGWVPTDRFLDQTLREDLEMGTYTHPMHVLGYNELGYCSGGGVPYCDFFFENKSQDVLRVITKGEDYGPESNMQTKIVRYGIFEFGESLSPYHKSQSMLLYKPYKNVERILLENGWQYASNDALNSGAYPFSELHSLDRRHYHSYDYNDKNYRYYTKLFEDVDGVYLRVISAFPSHNQSREIKDTSVIYIGLEENDIQNLQEQPIIYEELIDILEDVEQ